MDGGSIVCSILIRPDTRFCLEAGKEWVVSGSMSCLTPFLHTKRWQALLTCLCCLQRYGHRLMARLRSVSPHALHPPSATLGALESPLGLMPQGTRGDH
jgi:hypothetical protein